MSNKESIKRLVSSTENAIVDIERKIKSSDCEVTIDWLIYKTSHLLEVKKVFMKYYNEEISIDEKNAMLAILDKPFQEKQKAFDEFYKNKNKNKFHTEW